MCLESLYLVYHAFRDLFVIDHARQLHALPGQPVHPRASMRGSVRDTQSTRDLDAHMHAFTHAYTRQCTLANTHRTSHYALLHTQHTQHTHTHTY